MRHFVEDGFEELDCVFVDTKVQSDEYFLFAAFIVPSFLGVSVCCSWLAVVLEIRELEYAVVKTKFAAEVMMTDASLDVVEVVF